MRPQRGRREIAVYLFIKIAHTHFSRALEPQRDVHAAFALGDRAQNTSLDLPPRDDLFCLRQKAVVVLSPPACFAQ